MAVALGRRAASSLGEPLGFAMSSLVWEHCYDAHASEYARVLDPTLAGAVDRLVELAGAGPETRVLDVATGTGAVARAAARRQASVVAVDLSPGMLAVAAERVPEVDFRLADVHELPFEAGEFDVVTCGLAISHFVRPQRALGEVLRVLRPGGRFVASAWGPGGGTTAAFAAVCKALGRYGAAEKGYTLDEETWFRIGSGAEALRAAGFEQVGVTTELFSGAFANADEALAWTLAWPAGAARLARIDPTLHERFVADAREALAAADMSWSLAFNFYAAVRPALN